MVGMKAFTFFAFCLICGTFLSGVMEGQTAFAVTKTTIAAAANATSISVLSTTDFLDMDDIYWESEKVRYTSKTATQFNVSQRGLDGTEAVIHAAGVKVKNETTNVINSLLGYNVATTAATYGSFSAIVGLGWNLLGSIPRMIAWDYRYLDGQMQIIKYLILWPISAGFVFALAMMFVNTVMSIFRR